MPNFCLGGIESVSQKVGSLFTDVEKSVPELVNLATLKVALMMPSGAKVSDNLPLLAPNIVCLFS